jgi:hypothetical protein
MPLYTPKKVALNWYKYDLTFSIELLREYVNGIELQVAQSIKAFRDGKEKIVTEHPPNEDYWEITETYRGLDGETWDLNSIFEEYFPTLQRGSALITLFSFMEHELDNLCFLFANEKGIQIRLNDLQGKGIERAVKYLEKVVGLNIDKSGKVWAEVKAIQKIRNLVVHNGGRLKDRDGNPMEAELKYVGKSQYLSGDIEVHFGEGYLSHVLETFNELYRAVDGAIHRAARA